MSQDINRSLMESRLAEQLKQSRALKDSVLSHVDNSQYSIMNNASKYQIFSFEFVAVALFTYGYCSAVSKQELDAQAATSTLLAIFMTAPLCGANLNPMVSFSNCLKKENRYRWNLLGWYIGAQVAGASAGLFFSQFMGRKIPAELQLIQISAIFRVITNEGMGIFILILFLLLLSNPNTTFIESELSGYMSIAIFYFIARSFAPFAGLAINPAVTISLVIQYATKGQWQSLEHCWAWLLGDVIGCLLATYFYEYIYKPIVIQLREIRRLSENFESVTNEEGLSNKSLLIHD